MKATIDATGRIQLDSTIQQRLGVKPGDQVELEPHDDHLTLRPVESKTGLHLKDNVLVHCGAGTGSPDLVESDRDARDASLIQGHGQ